MLVMRKDEERLERLCILYISWTQPVFIEKPLLYSTVWDCDSLREWTATDWVLLVSCILYTFRDKRQVISHLGSENCVQPQPSHCKLTLCFMPAARQYHRL